MLSAAVGKTLNWSERDGVLYMCVHTPFEVQQLQREKNILTRKTAELYGKELKMGNGLGNIKIGNSFSAFLYVLN